MEKYLSRSAVMSPSNSEHSVIELSGRASGVRVDTAGIELEGALGSIDGNGYRAKVNLGLEGGLRTLSNIDHSRKGSGNAGGLELASTVLSSVRVSRLSVESV
jgi:hypothetical protein